MTDRVAGPDAIRPASERGRLIDARDGRTVSRCAHRRRGAAHRSRCFRDTPQYRCEPLSDALGGRLTLKVECLNPIRSFKGRGADHAVARLVEAGPAGRSCANRPETSAGLAHACRARGLALTVFAPTGANPLKIARMRALGAEVRLAGEDLADAKRAVREYARVSGAMMIEDGLMPEISEGAGTIARELLARGDAYDIVLVPLGDGALLNGMARWIKAASPATRVLGVCSEGAPAIAEAFARGPGAVPVMHAAHTIADGIAVSEPLAESVADMHGQVDGVLRVSDAHLLEAMRLLYRHAGVVVEPAGAAGVAALLATPQAFAGLEVATVLTGGNVTPEQSSLWFGTSRSTA
jgi:threonine dehydratase